MVGKFMGLKKDGVNYGKMYSAGMLICGFAVLHSDHVV
jgi:hypothetical protein